MFAVMQLIIFCNTQLFNTICRILNMNEYTNDYIKGGSR